ncbi:putative DNA-binding protein (MmcQ/YjbR family) [Diaminobutyricimonas aerilata]|uniref:Putative DNA-binding protein (MmcQ/YjbR family) n=1 Tax=Diaminobutyricimonas aerilata TaxID=1162967 RepID=A0A2M9CI53_9MICO|nr:MmcQ/YjbR family DNA-binding protein [Diaminobutyricimonas aerilata]PJJ71550.1 putative DNA-binding protein (MmcQ/YjbR family) [Diaminobutyricimonas aerilata]
MNGHDLQLAAVARAGSLPDAGLEQPFGPEWDVYKVRGRVFMLLTTLGEQPIVTLKATPEDTKALCAGFEHIAPGYHMNKRHWITLSGGDDIDAALVHELVTESFLLVVEKLPRARRPIGLPERGGAAD